LGNKRHITRAREREEIVKHFAAPECVRRVDRVPFTISRLKGDRGSRLTQDAIHSIQ